MQMYWRPETVTYAFVTAQGIGGGIVSRLCTKYNRSHQLIQFCTCHRHPAPLSRRRILPPFNRRRRIPPPINRRRRIPPQYKWSKCTNKLDIVIQEERAYCLLLQNLMNDDPQKNTHEENTTD